LGTGFGDWLSGLILSWKYKYPVATAWSTPGIALIIASTGHYDLYEAIGAFWFVGLQSQSLDFQAFSKSYWRIFLKASPVRCLQEFY
jgi:hypothetical protein